MHVTTQDLESEKRDLERALDETEKHRREGVEQLRGSVERSKQAFERARAHVDRMVAAGPRESVGASGGGRGISGGSASMSSPSGLNMSAAADSFGEGFASNADVIDRMRCENEQLEERLRRLEAEQGTAVENAKRIDRTAWRRFCSIQLGRRIPR